MRSTARTDLIDWVNQRRRGGFTPAEGFTVNEAVAALPHYSRPHIWRTLAALRADGLLRSAPSKNDGRIARFFPTRKWR